MSFLTIDDIQIYYESGGTGRTLIFIHAGIADSRMWDEQFDYFVTKCQVIRYDLRGFGKSNFSQTKFSHAKDLKKLIDHLQINKAHIVACSYGCQIAIDFSLEFPSYVSSLILVNGIPRGFKLEHENPSSLWKEVSKAFEEKNIQKTAELEALIWFVGRKRSKKAVEDSLFQKVVEMDEIALKNETSNPPKEYMIHSDALQKLPKLNIPITFIVGSLDEPDMVESCELVAKKFHYKLLYIKETAHLPNLEKPKEFNHLIQQIIENKNN